jgi:hypothetical protein
MTKLGKAQKGNLQSVRAKARKALAVDVQLPKTITGHLEAVVAYVDKQLAAKAPKEDAVAA